MNDCKVNIDGVLKEGIFMGVSTRVFAVVLVDNKPIEVDITMVEELEDSSDVAPNPYLGDINWEAL